MEPASGDKSTGTPERIGPMTLSERRRISVGPHIVGSGYLRRGTAKIGSGLMLLLISIRVVGMTANGTKRRLLWCSDMSEVEGRPEVIGTQPKRREWHFSDPPAGSEHVRFSGWRRAR